MELKFVPDHYQQEIYTIERAEFEARREIAAELEVKPHEVILPTF